MKGGSTKNTKEHEGKPFVELILKDEVFRIVGAAIEVHRELGNGFLEAVYQEALAIELSERGIPFVAQPTLQIVYKARVLGKSYSPDFVCFNKIIVELKALNTLSGNEEAQTINYLKATGKKVGLILNFGSNGRLDWKKIVY